MGMNIKNERVHDLARRAAEATGLSQTSAVEEGLRLLLEQHGSGAATDRQRRIDAMHAISAAWDPDPNRTATLSEAEDLYDPETGLPA